MVNSQGSPGGGIVARQLRVASDPWEADPLIWDHQLRVPGQFIFIFRISTQTSWNESLHLLAVSNDSLDHLLMQNHYNNGINFKNQMCQIFTYFVEKGMVALEDDEAVCIPEKIRLSMLNLTMSPSGPAYNSWSTLCKWTFEDGWGRQVIKVSGWKASIFGDVSVGRGREVIGCVHPESPIFARLFCSLWRLEEPCWVHCSEAKKRIILLQHCCSNAISNKLVHKVS